MRKIHVQIIRDTDDAFIARVEEYPELLATGFTLDELREAVEEQVEYFAGRKVAIDPESFGQLHSEPDVVLA